MKFTLFLSFFFMSSQHPISMTLIMIMITLYINIFMYFMMKYTWFLLLISLLILGGLMVIFLYITSLTPNKKFSFNKKLFVISIPLYLLIKMDNKMILSSSDFQVLNIFNYSSLLMMIYMMLYLMLTLISITIVVKSTLAPLKSN
uniref:NADH dehydrogenase subunit 6 n=1 Tax=Ornithodoros hermsi TaxID=303297 RepID=A0A3G2K023_9ACAR|nr:NADH dehydrogenase subunit 6 [Ornithodoros hermsi]AYN50647.1 NADH dehydrogenase subunit 6 [Ornithodoros hermsi]UYB78376.1 NADH dehydrogenase subunit 6 [Ornithodoros hermsi]